MTGQNILLFDSSGTLASTLGAHWQGELVAETHSLGELGSLLDDQPYDILVADVLQVEPEALLGKVVRHQPRLPVVILGGDRLSVEQAALSYSANVIAVLDLPADPQAVRRALAREPGAETLSESEFLSGLMADALAPTFQPVMDAASGRVGEAEVLARWHGAGGSLLGAGPILQQARLGGYMDVFTHRMLERGCKAQARWRADGLDIAFRINIAGENLNRSDFADLVLGLLGQHGTPPEKLRLEVAEADLGRLNGAEARSQLAKLADAGVGLSLDDFGGGYAALMDMEPIPFDNIVIDRRFTLTAVERPAARVILQSAIDLASKLGLTSTCEGVETDAHLSLVKQLGATSAMGYFIGKPMAEDAFFDWYAQRY